jgi:hypothetical protein
VVVGRRAVALGESVGESVGLVRVEERVLAVAPRESLAPDAQVLPRNKLVEVRVLGNNERLRLVHSERNHKTDTYESESW